VSGCNAHQREQLGLAHAVLQAEPYVEEDFVLMLGDNVFRANLGRSLTDSVLTVPTPRSWWRRFRWRRRRDTGSVT
jgi:UTP-glucose-1-phosphate uridylyltransferase